jgi:hypothetical protein
VSDKSLNTTKKIPHVHNELVPLNLRGDAPCCANQKQKLISSM